MGFLHNDIKPENVLLKSGNHNTEIEELVLIDFGLSTKYLRKMEVEANLMDLVGEICDREISPNISNPEGERD